MSTVNILKINPQIQTSSTCVTVISKFKTTWRRIDNDQVVNTEPAFYYLGIVSSTFSDRDDSGLRIGLNAVYFAHIIDEMTA